jgi:hypothetical protein
MRKRRKPKLHILRNMRFESLFAGAIWLSGREFDGSFVALIQEFPHKIIFMKRANSTLSKSRSEMFTDGSRRDAKRVTSNSSWEESHVASMSRGVAGKVLEALKTNGNFCYSKARGKQWKYLVISS